MSRIKRLDAIAVTTTGGNDVATGSGSVEIPGGMARLVGLAIDYHGSAPAGTDVVVKCTLPVEKTVLTKSNNNTDVPLAQVTEVEVDNVGADRASPATRSPLVMGSLTVDVAQCDALTDAVTVFAVIEVL